MRPICAVRFCDDPTGIDGEYCGCHEEYHDPVDEECNLSSCDSCGRFWMGDDW